MERAFGALKGRFKILASRPFFPFSTQVDIVIACCILHNYIIGHGPDEFVISEEDFNLQDVSQSGLSRREIREESNYWIQLREEIALRMWHDNEN